MTRGNEHHHLPSYMKKIFSMRYRFFSVVHSLSGQRLKVFGAREDLRRPGTSREGREARLPEPEGLPDEPGTATASVPFREVSVKFSQRSTVAWLLPELCSIDVSCWETFSKRWSCSASKGHGVRSRVEADVSRPSGQRTNAKSGFALSNSTLSTTGSLLLRTNYFHKHRTMR